MSSTTQALLTAPPRRCPGLPDEQLSPLAAHKGGVLHSCCNCSCHRRERRKRRDLCVAEVACMQGSAFQDDSQLRQAVNTTPCVLARMGPGICECHPLHFLISFFFEHFFFEKKKCSPALSFVVLSDFCLHLSSASHSHFFGEPRSHKQRFQDTPWPAAAQHPADRPPRRGFTSVGLICCKPQSNQSSLFCPATALVSSALSFFCSG